jgi:ribosomal protein S1
MKSSKFFGSANFASANNANTAHDDFDWDDVDGQIAYENNPMHELLNSSNSPIKHPGLKQLLRGTVVGRGKKEYFVSIPGVGSDAMLPFNEAETELSIGEPVSLFVSGIVPKSDAPMIVSQKRATIWLELQSAQEEGATVEVQVKDVVKRGDRVQGLKVTYHNGMEGFIPRSHFSRATIAAPGAEKTMNVKIVKANPQGKFSGELVFSDRLFMNEVADKAIAELEVGEIVTGVVKKFVTAQNNPREIGALVAIAYSDLIAFLHSSEISEGSRPSAVLSLDEEIEVEIISINKSKREVKVSYRAVQAAKQTAGLVVDEVIPATILRFREKVGFFVSIGNGFTALLPCSQVTDGRNVNVKPFFKAGDIINVVLTELNLDEGKAIVSYKAASMRSFVEGNRYQGVVNKILAEIGLYVICDGVGGLLHFSELNKGERLNSFKEGDSIEVSLKRISESKDQRALVAWGRRERNK